MAEWLPKPGRHFAIYKKAAKSLKNEADLTDRFI